MYCTDTSTIRNAGMYIVLMYILYNVIAKNSDVIQTVLAGQLLFSACAHLWEKCTRARTVWDVSVSLCTVKRTLIRCLKYIYLRFVQPLNTWYPYVIPSYTWLQLWWHWHGRIEIHLSHKYQWNGLFHSWNENTSMIRKLQHGSKSVCIKVPLYMSLAHIISIAGLEQAFG